MPGLREQPPEEDVVLDRLQGVRRKYSRRAMGGEGESRHGACTFHGRRNSPKAQKTVSLLTH